MWAIELKRKKQLSYEVRHLPCFIPINQPSFSSTLLQNTCSTARAPLLLRSHHWWWSCLAAWIPGIDVLPPRCSRSARLPAVTLCIVDYSQDSSMVTEVINHPLCWDLVIVDSLHHVFYSSYFDFCLLCWDLCIRGLSIRKFVLFLLFNSSSSFFLSLLFVDFINKIRCLNCPCSSIEIDLALLTKNLDINWEFWKLLHERLNIISEL